ncbi:MAG TPA: hypothetical protein PLI88_05590 [Bacillota bacterium]|nr:hypothetical protein [Bacillota bacterium]HPI01600.1 hypothetical protein [Bacillota bacterium]HPM64455.1 hypothetical protein [Bacillota bacterium]
MIGIMYRTKRLRGKSPLKLILTVTGISVFILTFGIIFSSCVMGRNDATELEEVLVRVGDTVWECVRKVYGYETDIRSAVARTIELNDIEDGIVYPGRVIVIPKPAV